MTEHRKFYGDNPDTIYDLAVVDGRRSYRIAGQRGTSEYLACCVYGRDAERRTRIVANVSDLDLDVAADGSFTIHLSAEPPPASDAATWVELPPDADTVIIRQYFLDRSTEVEGTYDITCLDEPGAPAALTAADITRRLRRIGRFVEQATTFSTMAAHVLSDRPNQPTIDSAAAAVVAFYPTPDNQYVGGWYRLGDGEALVVEGTPPETRYWSLLLMSRWMESLDTRYHQAILNKQQVTLEADGTFRIVVAHDDPGCPNWLDTSGQESGYVMFRWMQAAGVTAPTFRVVPLAEVAGGA
jgi:hypothetical protein